MIRIITDSGSDISQSEASKLGITVIPLKVRFNDIEYIDDVTITNEEFFNRLVESDELPKTSQLTPFDYTNVFDMIDKNDKAIVICLSGNLSGTYNSAFVASNDYDNIYVIDSKNVTIGQRLLVLRALELTKKYNNIDAVYHRSNKGGGYWENLKNPPKSWKINYKNLVFNIKQMGFKHTGLFPEQAVNWDFIIDKISNAGRNIKMLNLFGYTGAASVAALSAGASVVHVDSSRGMVDWCKENVKSSGFESRPIRYIVDDVVKFVKREIRRGNKYDAIIMDPPSYGRGANGEVWDIEKDLYNLVELCSELLTEEPLFVIINTYTTGLSKEVFTNVLKSTIGKNHTGKIYSEEIAIPIKNSDLVLPCGVCSRYYNE